VNGRQGFELLEVTDQREKRLPAKDMRWLLQREEELRLSKPIQDRFTDPDFSAILIAGEVQQTVALEYLADKGLKGTKEEVGEVVSMIRVAPALYPECPDFAHIPHYRRFNRARQGQLNIGDWAPDVRLKRLNGTSTCMSEYRSKRPMPSRPLVVVAGSYT